MPDGIFDRDVIGAADWYFIAGVKDYTSNPTGLLIARIVIDGHDLPDDQAPLRASEVVQDARQRQRR